MSAAPGRPASAGASVVTQLRDRRREHVDVSIWPRAAWATATVAVSAAPGGGIAGLIDESRRRRLVRLRGDALARQELQDREELQRAWLRGLWFFFQQTVTAMEFDARLAAQRGMQRRVRSSGGVPRRRLLALTLLAATHEVSVEFHFATWQRFAALMREQRRQLASASPDRARLLVALSRQLDDDEAASTIAAATAAAAGGVAHETGDNFTPPRGRIAKVLATAGHNSPPGRASAAMSSNGSLSRLPNGIGAATAAAADALGVEQQARMCEGLACAALERLAAEALAERTSLLSRALLEREALHRAAIERDSAMTSGAGEWGAQLFAAADRWLAACAGHLSLQFALRALVLMEELLRAEVAVDEGCAVVQLALHRAQVLQLDPAPADLSHTPPRSADTTSAAAFAESPSLRLLGYDTIDRYVTMRVAALQRVGRAFARRRAVAQLRCFWAIDGQVRRAAEAAFAAGLVALRARMAASASAPPPPSVVALLQRVGRGSLFRGRCAFQLWAADSAARASLVTNHARGIEQILALARERGHKLRACAGALSLLQRVGRGHRARRSLAMLRDFLALDLQIRLAMLEEHIHFLRKASASLASTLSVSDVASRGRAAVLRLQRVGRGRIARARCTFQRAFWQDDSRVRAALFAHYTFQCLRVAEVFARQVTQRDHRAGLSRLIAMDETARRDALVAEWVATVSGFVLPRASTTSRVEENDDDDDSGLDAETFTIQSGTPQEHSLGVPPQAAGATLRPTSDDTDDDDSGASPVRPARAATASAPSSSASDDSGRRDDSDGEERRAQMELLLLEEATEREVTSKLRAVQLAELWREMADAWNSAQFANEVFRGARGGILDEETFDRDVIVEARELVVLAVVAEQEGERRAALLRAAGAWFARARLLHDEGSGRAKIEAQWISELDRAVYGGSSDDDDDDDDSQRNAAAATAARAALSVSDAAASLPPPRRASASTAQPGSRTEDTDDDDSRESDDSGADAKAKAEAEPSTDDMSSFTSETTDDDDRVAMLLFEERRARAEMLQQYFSMLLRGVSVSEHLSRHSTILPRATRFFKEVAIANGKLRTLAALTTSQFAAMGPPPLPRRASQTMTMQDFQASSAMFRGASSKALRPPLSQ